MKKFLLVFCAFLMTVSTSAQKLKVNEIDKFTNSVKKQTSSETLFTVGMLTTVSSSFSFAIRKTDDSYTMPANIMLPDIEKYTEDSGITFLLSNNDVVVLKTLYTGISSRPFPHSGYEFGTCFRLTEDDVQKLKDNKITAIRINYLGGHYDRDIKTKKQDIVSRCLKLVDEE